MDPKVIYDEAAGTYQLVAEIDGVTVPFFTVQATYVQALKQAQADAEAANPPAPAAEPSTPPPPPAP